ncbi:uncharacterized protein LOC136042141 [Artemia franciscana]|uniref:uncharacterized protein LOC136042141 n=1 Tax=Artemia franciscana TaxID=6661 RepID=UPI0032DB1552
MRLKLRLLNSNVMSILLYASECWKLNTQLEKRVLAFENMCLRRILNISWQEKVTNIEVRRRTGQPLVTDLLKRRRWTYLGHVLRMPQDRLPNTVYDWRPEGRRKRGRPRHTLRRQYDRDLRNAELSLQPQWEDVMAAAQLRDVWRGFDCVTCRYALTLPLSFADHGASAIGPPVLCLDLNILRSPGPTLTPREACNAV